ncbi:MAG: GNAT family N-acetyltransferase, partial [Chloroflexota bacterium]|nr:GNAT family N-acetyltransferase [Chloroflexota bacterium]
MPDDARLLAIQVETLLRVGADGRLLAVNEAGEPPPGGDPPAPRVFLGRSRAGNVVRYRHDLPTEIVRALDRLVGGEPVASSLDGEPPTIRGALHAALRAHGDIRAEWRGPAYRFPANDRNPLPHAVVTVDDRNASLLDGPFASVRPWLTQTRPCVAVVRDGAAVAVCRSVRRSPQAAEAGVETLPDFRGRGYGAAVVAAWARAVRGEGLLPLY